MLFLTRWLTGTSAFGNYQYQAFIRRIVELLFNHYGTNVVADEPYMESFARTLAINLACGSGVVLDMLNAKILQTVVNNQISISPDVQASIYCNGLRQTSFGAFQFFFIYDIK